MCVHSGVSLENWKTSDLAWQEHAKWSPACVYVAHIKGPELVLNSAGIGKGFLKCVCCVFCVLTIASVVCASKELNEVSVIVIASTPGAILATLFLLCYGLVTSNYLVLCIALSLIQQLCAIFS